jgi:hypothetical protein
MTHSTQQGVFFDEGFPKPVQVLFDSEGASSDGGLPLLSKLDRRLALTASLAECIGDPREPGKVRHHVLEMLRQRIFGLALGYPDVRDADRISADPCLKHACDRGPLSGEDLASAATLCRFENRVRARELVLMQREMAKGVIKRLHGRCANPRRVVLDFDPSVDETHGEQQMSLFDGFYRHWCYLPIFGFLSVPELGEQHLVHARLRPGAVSAARGFLRPLRRMVREIRHQFGSRIEILVRLDSAFAKPIVLDTLEALGLKYVVSFPSNPVLKRWVEPLLECTRILAKGEDAAVRQYDELPYRARAWRKRRRLIVKAEVIPYKGRATKDNPRYVLTNLPRTYKPEAIYELHCQRGEAENRIKELKNDLEIDRTSCSSYVANQARVMLTSAAYVLMQELRWELRETEFERAQVGRLRLCLLKIGARVSESVRRIVMHCPRQFPYARAWGVAAGRLGARPLPAT